MIAAIRTRALPALFALALAAGATLTAAPAAATRAWVQTETILLDRPGHDGRMVGQYLTCDEVRILETHRGWVLVSGRRGNGWMQSAMLARFEPGGCRYEFRAFRSLHPPFPIHPDHPPHPVRPPRPEHPPHPVRPPRPERPPMPTPPIWSGEPEVRQPYWGP